MFEEIIVLYGSQTGTAEDASRHIHRLLYQANQLTKQISLFSCDEFLAQKNVNRKSSLLVIFVCSTTGNGDPPENMRFLWRAIMSRQFVPSLIFGETSEIDFAVLGLGDSTYDRFNFVAKKLQRRFEQVLKKDSMVEVGLSDEQDVSGIYSVADDWTLKLFEKLELTLPSTQALPNFRFEINELKEVRKTEDLERILRFPCDAATASLKSKERLTCIDHFQDVRMVKLGIKDIVYYPGDVCFVQPGNIADQVEEFSQIFSVDPGRQIQIDDKNGQKFILSVRTLLNKYFNLCHVPSRSFFDLLSRFTEDEMEKERLQELATNYDDLLDYSIRPKRSIVEVFGDFRTTTEALRRLPLNQLFKWLFELIPPIRPRAFSIASAQVESGAEIELLIAIVQYQTKIKKQRRGLCTTWLVEKEPDPEKNDVPIWIRPSSMRFPKIRPAPSLEPFPKMILLGPGTGLAPFRAYIQYRRNLGRIYGSDVLCVNKENLWLFFGCRYEKKDFLCGKELLNYEQEDTIRLDTAFSRDTPHKVYVQNKINVNKREIAEWILEKGANIYIAGSALQMPKDVMNAIQEALVGSPNDGLLNSFHEAELYLQNMEKSGRYVVETWS